MKKKLIILGMCVALACSAAACGKDDKNTASSGEVASAGEFSVEKTKADMKGTQYKSTVELGQYKGLKVGESDSVATAGEIDQAIDNILSNNAEAEKIESGVVEDGDVANIDFVGKMDGKEFEGGSGEAYDLEIGSGSFIAGFEDGLIGKKVGEKVDLDLTFPKDYKDSSGNVSDLAGKDVVFTVTINYITRHIKPELSDAFVKEKCQSYDSETVAELKDYLADQIVLNKKLTAIWQTILDDSKVTFNEEEVNKLVSQMKEQYSAYYTAYGLSLEDYYEYAGITEEEFNADMKESVESSLTNIVISMNIARKEGIEVTEEEYLDEVEADVEAGTFGSVEAFQQQYPKQDTVDSILYYKVLEWVADSCEIVPDEEVETTTSKDK